MPRHAAFGVGLGDLDIVVIDDSEAMLSILRAILGAFGVASLRLFDNSERALDAMINEPPHLVLMDWRMRPIEGHELLKTIRSRHMAPLCYAAVMVVSGHASEDLVRRAFIAGANQFLVKPVAPTTVLGRLVWLQHDTRELVLAGGRYAVEGVERAFGSGRGRQRIMLDADG